MSRMTYARRDRCVCSCAITLGHGGGASRQRPNRAPQDAGRHDFADPAPRARGIEHAGARARRLGAAAQGAALEPVAAAAAGAAGRGAGRRVPAGVHRRGGRQAGAQSRRRRSGSAPRKCSRRRPRLQWVQVFWAGVEDCVAVPALRERGLLLTNMQRVAGPVMAEHVIAMMLAFARGTAVLHPGARGGALDRGAAAVGADDHARRQDRAGRGPGRHRHRGRAPRARARHARDRHAGERPRGPGLRELRRLAGRTAQARGGGRLHRQYDAAHAGDDGIFDAAFFAAAKPGAYFINVGRGGSVVRGRSGRRAAQRPAWPARGST